MKFFLFAILLSPTAMAFEPLKKADVLVYRGPGACEGCAETPAELAKSIGLNTRFVGPSSIVPDVLRNARVWIQPGGDALELTRIFNSAKMQTLRDFVWNGGSFVGLCAGAFLADSTVDDAKTIPGLGLIPGETYDYLSTQEPTVLPITWGNEVRQMYYQAGPAFRLDSTALGNVQVLARYADGSPAAIQFYYGKGKVVLSGPHPEATPDWFAADKLIDPDGSETELALEMFRWAYER